MQRIVHLTSVHDPLHPRLFHKKCRSAQEAGFASVVIAPGTRAAILEGIEIIPVRGSKSKLVRMSWTAAQVIWKAARMRAALYEIEDPELLPWAVVLRKITGTPCVYDAKEYHSLAVLWKEWIPAGFRRLVAFCTEKIEKACVRWMDGVIVINPHMRELFAPYCRRIAVVHNYPRRFSIPEPSGERDPKKIVFLGSLSRERGYELLLEALEQVHAIDKDAFCTMIGSVHRLGLSPAALDRERKLLADGVLRPLGEIPYAEIWRHLHSSAVGWVTFLRTPNNELGMPNKLFEYMAAAVPVVAPDLRFIAPIVRNAECGIVVGAGEPAAHAAALVRLLQDSALAQAMGARGREAILSTYNWESQAEVLQSFYRGLLSGPPGKKAAFHPIPNATAQWKPEKEIQE